MLLANTAGGSGTLQASERIFLFCSRLQRCQQSCLLPSGLKIQILQQSVLQTDVLQDMSGTLKNQFYSKQRHLAEWRNQNPHPICWGFWIFTSKLTREILMIVLSVYCEKVVKLLVCNNENECCHGTYHVIY